MQEKVKETLSSLGINLNVSKTETGNRNVFVKFGTAKLKVESAGVDFSGVFSKNQQGDILHYYSKNSNIEGKNFKAEI